MFQLCALFVLSSGSFMRGCLCALQQVYEHTMGDDAALKKLIKQLLAIISRPARLLEVLVSNAYLNSSSI